MSVKKSNNTVSVISNGATVKKPEIAGVSYAGNLGIPAAVGQPSAVGLTGGGYAENIERYYGGGNSLAGGGSLTVSPANGNGLTGGLYGSFLGSGAGSSPVGSLTPATSLAGSALAGKNLTGGLYGQNLDRYFDSNVVGRVGAGIGGGASRGGVTNEGVIVGGSTGNLEKFPTIGNGNGNVSPRLPSNGSIGSRYPSPNLPSGLLDLKGSYTDRLNQFASGLFTPSKSTSAGTGTPSKETNSGSNAEQTPPPATEETESSEPMTYEEYIEEAKKGYQAQLDAAKKQAEQTRQRAIVDAQSGYMQNLASYGANAEQMADAGMQGGGYSDYLNAQAYAQKRSDVQQANAQAAYENQAAEGTYQGYINSLNQQLAQKALDDQRLADQREYEQKQTEDERQYQKELLEEQRQYEEEQYQRQKADSEKQQRDSLYADLWQGVLDPNSTYTAEAIDEFAREYGLSEQQATSLKNLLAATHTKTAAEKSAGILSSLLSDIESGMIPADGYLDSLKTLGLSDDDYNKAKSAVSKKVYEQYSSDLASGSITGQEIANAHRGGNLTDEDYNKLVKQYQDQAQKEINDDMFKGVGKDNADALLEEFMNDELLSAAQKDQIKKAYDRFYSGEAYATSGEYTVRHDGYNYKPKKKLDSNANEIRHNDDFKEQLANLGFTDPYDKNIPNGTTFTINCEENGSNQVDYEDFGLFDVTDWRSWVPGYNIYTQLSKWFNWNKRTVTYYNGQWYLAEKV